MKVHEVAAKNNIPVKTRIKQRVPWEDDIILKKRENIKMTYLEKLIRKTRKSDAELKEANKDLREAYD